MKASYTFLALTSLGPCLIGLGYRARSVQIFTHVFDKSFMRFHDQLDDILGNPIRLRLLRILIRTEGRGFTGRDLAKRCGSSASQVTSSLQALESSGLVVREIVGRAHLWRMADGHVLLPVLTALFRAEADSLSTLKGQLQASLRNLPIERAALFGSVARGDERATSDIDLFVVVRTRADKRKVEDELSGASLDFAIKFGNPLSALVMEESRLRGLANPALLASIRQEGIDLGSAP